ncbi:MAG: polysaccharide biosynthesis C-terminal domain-containing protein [Bacteroidota bacterium]|nr:polysaccharide biosynthesis C-terminal domain-containing protein [Bacteroidota bacterium]
MGIIRKQSIKNSINLYLGVVIGAVNTILVFPFVFEDHPEYWGLLQLLVSYSVVVSSFSHLGSPQILIRYFPFFKIKDKLVSFTLMLTLLGFALFLLFFFSFKTLILDSIANPLLSEYNILLLVLVFGMVFFDVFNSVSRSYLDSTTPIFLNDVFLRVITLVLLVCYHYSIIDFKQFIYFYAYSYILKLVVLGVIQFYKQRIQLDLLWDKESRGELMSYGLYVIMGSGAAILVSRVDIIMIEHFLDLKSVAFYGLAFFIGSVIKVPARSITSISTPLIAQAFKENNIGHVKEIYQKTSINLLVISMFMFLVIWLNIDDILMILPEKFRAGKFVVLFIGLSQVVNLASGLNGLIIINSNFYRTDLLFNITLLVLVILTNILLIPMYGINGAALASLISVTLHNVLKLLFIYFKMNIQPFSIQTLKVLLLSSILFVFLSFLPIIENNFLAIAIRSLLILLTYVSSVLAFKLSSDINDYYSQLKSKFNELLR